MFDLLKRDPAAVGVDALGMQYVRFFAGTDGRPKVKDSAGNLVEFTGPQGATGATGAQGPQGATGATGATGAQGDKGWSPILAVVSDGERRVLRLVDWTGGAGTKPAVPTDNYIGMSGFTTLAGATDIRGPQGQTGVAPTQNTFANVSVGTSPTPTLLQSDAPADILTVNAGAGISLTADAATDTYTIVNADPGSASRTAHEAAADPHPQYTTTAEASAAAPVQSVNGQTGAVTVVPGRARIGPPVLANATTTTETVVARWSIPANFLVAGDSIRAVVMHQSAGTGTLIYRLRIGAAGTIADGLVATLTTSAAQVANAQGRADMTVYFPNNATATGSGFAVQQAAVLGTVTGAGANVTISNAAAVQLSVTVQCSAAAANVTRGAHAVVGD